jgi:hypothetical protein
VTYIPIPVAVAHQIGDRHKKDIVLIVGWDEDSNKTNIVTWGREPPQKEAAAKAGDTVVKQLGLLMDGHADVHEDFRREGEAALEVDRLRLLAVELWNVRGPYSLSVEDEEKMLARFPWLRAVSVDSPA